MFPQIYTAQRQGVMSHIVNRWHCNIEVNKLRWGPVPE